MIPFLQQLHVSFHTCVLFRKILFVFLYGAAFQDQVLLSPVWMKNPLQIGYSRTESQASGLKMNVLLILNTTFLIVVRKAKNLLPEFQSGVWSGMLLEAANLAAGPPTSKTSASESGI